MSGQWTEARTIAQTVVSSLSRLLRGEGQTLARCKERPVPAFNIVMAILLLASLYPVFADA
jgi:hypothetical protein